MAGNGTARDGFGAVPHGHHDDDWSRPERPPFDWKKAILVVGLGTLSWVATYVGMLELIESNMGTLPLEHRLIIACAVAMLMIMIVWLLDQIFSPAPLARKVIYAAGYLFLTLISVGFGFGFYWKVLESRSEATRSAQSAVGQVQTAMHAGSTRLTQLNSTLVQLRDLSQRKAVEEREKGTSCPNSSPGDGPRRALRDADAEKFAFASQFVSGRIDELDRELSTFDAELAKISNDNAEAIQGADGTRNEFMRGLDRRLDIAVAGFNAFRTDPQLQQIRQDLAQRAEKTIFPTSSGGSFACPDPQLQAALRGVVRAIDQLPELGQPKIAAVEGSEATIEAFRRLTATLFGVLTFELPPSPEDLRQLQREAVKAATDNAGAARQAQFEATPAGLSKRDYIPLALAIFVDLCLLLVSMGRPMNRFGGIVDKMREAEKGPVIRILSRFNDIHRDEDIRRNFEVFRHVVFDFHGAYYVAVPLDTPYNRIDPRSGHAIHYGASDAQDLQHEAHLLANLFASFEKEKIFTRVYSPLLTTRGIQKRLARQGSKFAGSSAFRLYRFRDGAWSDLILGAVMGAAKRVETAQRRQAIEAGSRLPKANEEVAQATGEVPDGGAPVNEPPASEDDRPARGAARSRNNAFAADPGEEQSSVLFAHAGDRRAAAAGPLRTAAVGLRGEAGPVAQASASSADDPRAQSQSRPAPVTETFASQFGSYAAAARAELVSDDRSWSADDEFDPDSDDTTGGPPIRDAQVIALPARPAAATPAHSSGPVPETAMTPPPLPSSAPTRRRVGGDAIEALRETQVTLMRETATFSLPSDAIGFSDLADQANGGLSGRFEPRGVTSPVQGLRHLDAPVRLDSDDEADEDDLFLPDTDLEDATTARTLARRLSPENKD